MAEKEGGVVKEGHDDGMKMAISLLQKFELPQGLLPTRGCGGGTGCMWVVQQKKVEHEFKMISKLVSYDTEIHSSIEKGKIWKLKGVKAKELILWPPVSEITADLASGKIHFRAWLASPRASQPRPLLQASEKIKTTIPYISDPGISTHVVEFPILGALFFFLGGSG